MKAAAEINEGKSTAADFDVDLPTGRQNTGSVELGLVIWGGCFYSYQKKVKTAPKFEAADLYDAWILQAE